MILLIPGHNHKDFNHDDITYMYQHSDHKHIDHIDHGIAHDDDDPIVPDFKLLL